MNEPTTSDRARAMQQFIRHEHGALNAEQQVARLLAVVLAEVMVLRREVAALAERLGPPDA